MIGLRPLAVIRSMSSSVMTGWAKQRSMNRPELPKPTLLSATALATSEMPAPTSAPPTCTRSLIAITPR